MDVVLDDNTIRKTEFNCPLTTKFFESLSTRKEGYTQHESMTMNSFNNKFVDNTIHTTKFFRAMMVAKNYSSRFFNLLKHIGHFTYIS